MFGVKEDSSGAKGFDIVIGNPPYIQLQKFKGQKIQRDLAKMGYEAHAPTGDIYCLFYEKGIGLLRAGGRLIYITSNKWMRAGYGARMRKFFVENTNPLKLLDFGGHKIFDEATVDCSILLVEKASNQKQCQGCVFTGQEARDLQRAFENNKVVVNNLSEQNWVIADAKSLALKEKIERMGVPLKDWEVSIYRGVITGYNKAFIIDQAKRDELIAKDPQSEDIIKPVLRGRDIKRYGAKFAGLYLIYSFSGINIDAFAAIKNHLLQYKTQLEKRRGGARWDDKGNFFVPYKWYELQVDYYHSETYKKFEKEKVVFTKASKESSFAFISNSIYLLQTAYILTGDSLKLINVVLNSRLLKFLFARFYQSGGIEGEITVQSVEQFPIPKPRPEVERQAGELVDKMMSLQERYHEAKTEAEREQVGEQIEAVDREMEGLVWGVYGLTEEEVGVVKGMGSKGRADA